MRQYLILFYQDFPPLSMQLSTNFDILHTKAVVFSVGLKYNSVIETGICQLLRTAPKTPFTQGSLGRSRASAKYVNS